jgi:hypothetical protein
LERNRKRKMFYLIIPCLAVLVFAFQNCQKGYMIKSSGEISSASGNGDVGPNSKECVLNGVSYQPGNSITGYELYSVMAPVTCGSKVVRTCLAGGQFDGSVPLYDVCTQLTSQSNAVDALPAGQWMEVPNSKIKDVFPAVSVGGYSSAVVGAWSGGAYDTKRDRLIVWGGGHGDYAGNEIYVFDLNSLKWVRLNDPSPVPGDQFDSGYYPDGGPVSRHTYNYLQYLPDPVDRFCSFGGAGFWRSGQYGTNHVDCFNFDKNSWETQKFQDTPSTTIGADSAYDPVTNSVWHHGGYGDIGMSRLDLATGKWTQLWAPFSGAGYTLGYQRTSDIDPINRKMVAVGAGKVLVWDLTKPGLNYATEVTTTGPQTVVTGASGTPGFVYVPELKAFVGWSGGSDIYKLDLLTMAWTAMPRSGSTTPPALQKNWGTFGRLRYSPKKKALVLVNDHDENVLIYKVK